MNVIQLLSVPIRASENDFDVDSSGYSGHKPQFFLKFAVIFLFSFYVSLLLLIIRWKSLLYLNFLSSFKNGIALVFLGCILLGVGLV